MYLRLKFPNTTQILNYDKTINLMHQTKSESKIYITILKLILPSQQVKKKFDNYLYYL